MFESPPLKNCHDNLSDYRMFVIISNQICFIVETITEIIGASEAVGKVWWLWKEN